MKPSTTVPFDKQQPIIFLDIDGVLNSHLFNERRADGPGGWIRVMKEGSEIDPLSVDILNSLIEKTNAQVVISSTWRLHGQDYVEEYLCGAGFKGTVIGITDDLRRGDKYHSIFRGNEIYCWINDHPELTGCPRGEYKRYVIFDDDSDMLLWQKDNFIQVDPYCGITPRNVSQAVKILNADLRSVS